MPSDNPIAVLGSGSWGTALALLISRNGHTTRMWTPKPESAAVMQKTGHNPDYLSQYPFPACLTVSSHLPDVLKSVRDILIVVPSVFFEEVLRQLQPHLTSNMRIALGTKGLARDGLLHEAVTKQLKRSLPLAVIGGPSLAKEVAAGLPTAVVLASNDTQFSEALTARLYNPYFRVYQSDDIAGVGACAVIKNVLAVGVGISDGLSMGSNARAALITRGLSEMRRLSCALGGAQETVGGLAGVGDLVLTCTDNASRNRRFGLALGGRHGQKGGGKISGTSGGGII